MRQIEEVRALRIDNLKVEIYPTREQAGVAAARAAAEQLRLLANRLENAPIGVIFATGASQADMLRELVTLPALPWDRVVGFHMDEYIGLPDAHPASFRRYLRERLVHPVQMRRFLEVDGNASDPGAFCQAYAQQLRSVDPQLCLLGVGENGHLAFNDPGVADFNDPLDMKVVALDATCRRQQAAEGWFSSLNEVPRCAMTLTIPAIFRVPRLIVSVPGNRKAHIMQRVFKEAISTSCPATLLRKHPDATVYLDRDSTSEIDIPA